MNGLVQATMQSGYSMDMSACQTDDRHSWVEGYESDVGSEDSRKRDGMWHWQSRSSCTLHARLNATAREVNQLAREHTAGDRARALGASQSRKTSSSQFLSFVLY